MAIEVAYLVTNSGYGQFVGCVKMATLTVVCIKPYGLELELNCLYQQNALFCGYNNNYTTG